jgi:hypothetical protein
MEGRPPELPESYDFTLLLRNAVDPAKRISGNFLNLADQNRKFPAFNEIDVALLLPRTCTS